MPASRRHIPFRRIAASAGALDPALVALHELDELGENVPVVVFAHERVLVAVAVQDQQLVPPGAILSIRLKHSMLESANTLLSAPVHQQTGVVISAANSK